MIRVEGISSFTFFSSFRHGAIICLDHFKVLPFFVVVEKFLFWLYDNGTKIK